MKKTEVENFVHLCFQKNGKFSNLGIFLKSKPHKGLCFHTYNIFDFDCELHETIVCKYLLVVLPEIFKGNVEIYLLLTGKSHFIAHDSGMFVDNRTYSTNSNENKKIF